MSTLQLELRWYISIKRIFNILFHSADVVMATSVLQHFEYLNIKKETNKSYTCYDMYLKCTRELWCK